MNDSKQMQPSSVIRNSEIPWIGTIPENWEIMPLKSIADILMGQSPPSEDVTDEGVIPFLQGNAEFGLEHPVPIHYCDVASKICSPGDILMSVRAPVGETNIADQQYAIGRGLCAITSKIDADFMKFALKKYSKDLLVYSNGSTFDAITMGSLSNFRIAVPPIEEQSKIASILTSECSTIDAMMVQQNRVIKALMDLKQSIISEVVTIGLDHSITLKDSGVDWIGSIPESWGLTKVSNQYDVTLGKMLCTSPETPDSTEENYLCSANVKRNGIEGDIKTMWFTPKEKEEYLLKEGDLIISEGGNAGTPMIYDGSRDPCYIQNAVHRVRAYDNQDIRNRFLYYWMSFAKDIGYVDLVCNKATIAHFTKKKLMEVPVVSIDLDTMSDIVHHLDSKCTQIDLEINYTSGLIDKMSDYKQSLIYEYVTGKRSVDVEAS